jgi:hypothetical protein
VIVSRFAWIGFEEGRAVSDKYYVPMRGKLLGNWLGALAV